MCTYSMIYFISMNNIYIYFMFTERRPTFIYTYIYKYFSTIEYANGGGI